MREMNKLMCPPDCCPPANTLWYGRDVSINDPAGFLKESLPNEMVLRLVRPMKELGAQRRLDDEGLAAGCSAHGAELACPHFLQLTARWSWSFLGMRIARCTVTCANGSFITLDD
jgi:hypothetical protein